MTPPPQIIPDPLWKRAYLQAGAAYWHTRCLIRACTRDTQPLVPRLRHRALVRDGWPTGRHLDHGVSLTDAQRQCLTDLDTEITTWLPNDLKAALTCKLPQLPGARLARLAFRRGQS